MREFRALVVDMKGLQQCINVACHVRTDWIGCSAVDDKLQHRAVGSQIEDAHMLVHWLIERCVDDNDAIHLNMIYVVRSNSPLSQVLRSPGRSICIQRPLIDLRGNGAGSLSHDTRPHQAALLKLMMFDFEQIRSRVRWRRQRSPSQGRVV